MRIAIVADRIFPFYNGGYERAIYEISTRITGDNSISWYTTTNSICQISQSSLDKITIISIARDIDYLNKRNLHSPVGIIRFLLALFKSKGKIINFDVVVVNSVPFLGIDRFIRRLKLKNKNVITLFHEAWYQYPKNGVTSSVLRLLIRSLIRKIVKLSDFIISVSSATTNSLVQNYNAPADKIETIPLGVSGLCAEALSRDTASRGIDLTFVGRLASIKRVQDLIEAVEMLKKKGKLVRCFIVGDGELRENLAQNCQEKGLHNEISFLGYVSNKERDRILSDSKLFVMPSEREGFSLSTLEALSLGAVPIVAKSNLRELFGIGEYLSNNVNGLTYKSGDIDELANLIWELLKKPEEIDRMRGNALLTARKYTWENCSKHFEMKLKEILR